MKVIFHPHFLKLRHTFRISRESRDVQETLIVELTDGTISGYGEATANPYYKVTVDSMQDTIKKIKIPDQWETPTQLWNLLKNQFGKDSFAQCAIDLAAYDFWGKKNKKPVWQMLGLDVKKTLLSNYTIGIDSIPKMVTKMEEFKDWPIFKIKLGTKEDLEIVRELRKHTKAVFRVDANCGWTMAQTIDFSHALKELNVEFIEQPMPADKWVEMEEVTKKSALPIIADESCIVEGDVDKCLKSFHGINIKLTKCGGISPALRMIKKAKDAGKKVMVGCMTESTVGISAIAQLLPLLDYVDMDGAVLLGEDIADGVKVVNGKAVYPSQVNGSGITLKEKPFPVVI